MLRFILFILLFLLFNTAFAISFLPGSVEPSRVKENYLTTTPTSSTPSQQIVAKQPEKTPLGKEAEKIKFQLKKIILKGNHVYSSKELETLYADKINKTITIVELFAIVDSITNYYRNNGYILSQAVLPPQKITNSGVVTIQIVEGYIDKVKIVGNPRGARAIILAYGEQIKKNRPLKFETMTHYMYLANKIPGAEIKAVLEPSKRKTGAADLNLVVVEKLITGILSYDDYGTLYMGPHQITGAATLNSIFLSGDSTTFTYLTATQDHELRYGDISYSTFLGSKGLQLTLDGNKSLTHPGFVLEPLDTIGNAITYSATLQYPVILTADQNLTLNGSLLYVNSRTTQSSLLLYDDRIRPASIGATYTVSDRFLGSNYIAAQLTHGFNIWNASNDPNSLKTSRFGADGIFTKWNLQATRLQGIYDRFSAFFIAQGQYSYNPLLTYEQFGFGGSQLGRGYDPAEILGDRGLAGSAELRMDIYPEKLWINTLQLYAFYDAGVVWDLRNLPTNPQKQSATSTGMGVRVAFAKYISGNFMITQPLTKSVAAEELIGRGKNPRTFFSIVGNFA